MVGAEFKSAHTTVCIQVPQEAARCLGYSVPLSVRRQAGTVHILYIEEAFLKNVSSIFIKLLKNFKQFLEEVLKPLLDQVCYFHVVV